MLFRLAVALAFAAALQAQVAGDPVQFPVPSTDLADVGCAAVASSATPAFDAGAANCFVITLTAEVTSSTLTGELPGRELAWVIKQDEFGAHPFVWPAEVIDACTIAPAADAVTLVKAWVDGDGVTVTECKVKGGADAWGFACVAASSVPTPPTDEVELFCDLATGELSAKNDAGTVTSLEQSGAANALTAASAAGGANLPVFSAGADRSAQYGTRSGNTSEVATVSGTKTVAKQLAFDAEGNVIASAYDVGAAGGGGSPAEISIFRNFGSVGSNAGNWSAQLPTACMSPSGAVAGGTSGTNITAGTMIFDDATGEEVQCREGALPADVDLESFTFRIHVQQLVNETTKNASFLLKWACYADGTEPETSPTWETTGTAITRGLTGGLSSNRYVLFESAAIDLTEAGANDCDVGAFLVISVLRNEDGADSEPDTALNTLRVWGWEGFAPSAGGGVAAHASTHADGGADEVAIDVSGQTNLATDGQGIELAGDQLALELDGATLEKSASGLKVAASYSAPTAAALEANGGNCSAGSKSGGVSAAGAAEDCEDVALQSELDAHDHNGGDGAAIPPGGVTAALKTDVVCMAITDPVTGDSAAWQWLAPVAVTITEVSCSTDTGTATVQLDERAKATPNTAGTDVMTSTLACDSDTQSTTSFTNAGIALDAWLNLDLDAVSGATKMRLCARYTRD